MYRGLNPSNLAHVALGINALVRQQVNQVDIVHGSSPLGTNIRTQKGR